MSATTPASLAGFDSRRLLQEVERLVGSLEPGDEEASAVERIAEAVTSSLGAELGVSGGRIYLRHHDDYRLWSTFGTAREVSRGTRVPFSYPPLKRCLEQGTVYATAEDPDVDVELERRLGAQEFVALEVGDRRILLVFDVDPQHQRDRVLFALALLRYAINQRIREERIEDTLRQARRIQASILPQSVPELGSYDIAFRSDPLETVGGDFCDFIPLTDKILGLVIADVSGHGLPAALQVRDIYMGLRMGTARDFKIVRTVERLNQIINLSTLTSRFVSMFYGELEEDGTFIYVNAGHPAPFLLRRSGDVRYLTEGGVFLGPIPDATYTRGFLTMEPGDILVLYTDGVVEVACAEASAESAAGASSGLVAGPGLVTEDVAADRLLALVQRLRRSSAAAIVEAIFADLDSCCEGASATDDRTVVVVKSPE